MSAILTFTRDGHAHVDGIRRPKRASFSALDKWRDCPGRWVGEKTFRKPLDWANPMTLGGIVHAALELATAQPDRTPDWFDLCLKGIDVERERVARRGWGGPVLPENVAMPDGVIPEDADWAREAAAKLSGFRLSDALGRPLHPAAREQEFNVELWGIPMTGSIDYRDADGSVVDWKTGKVPRFPSARERHADQLRTYNGFLTASGTCEVRSARDVYVEHSQWVQADLSKAAMAHTGSVFAAAWDGIVRATGRDGDGMYALNPGFLCGWCPLAGACPVAQFRGAKSRAAAAGSVGSDDPRIAYEDAGLRPLARAPIDDGQPQTSAKDDGFMPTHPAKREEHKENDMASTDDLMSMLLTPSAAPAKKREPRKTTGEKVAERSAGNPDPWASETGRKAMATWGIKPQPTAAPEPTFVSAAEFAPKRQVKSPRHEEQRGEDPWMTVDGEDVPKAQSAPKDGDNDDPWGAPAAPSDDWTRAEEKPAPQPKAPEPAPQPVAEEKAKAAPAATFKLSQGRPYDPSDNGKGYINTAGYGFAHYLSTYAKAALMAGATSEDTGAIAVALLRAQWATARAAFGAAVPDVPGLMNGSPDRHALFAWLDTALCRDADRALASMMDADPNLKPEAALGAVETVRRINLAARRAGEALGAAMASLR